MLSILTQFQSNRSQHVMVDGCLSKLVNVVLTCFGPVIVPPAPTVSLFHSVK